MSNVTISKGFVLFFTAVSLCFTGVPVASGGVAEDIAALQPGYWYRIQNSKMSSVEYPWPDPPGFPAGNNIGVPGVLSAWSDAAYDTTNKRLLIFGGGHKAYGGNEIYAFNFDSVTNPFAWERLTDPSSYDDAMAFYNGSDGYRSSGYYADGLPCSRHTYNSLTYSAIWNALCYVGTRAVFSGDAGPPNDNFDCYDFGLDSWVDKGSSPNDQRSSSEYDPNTGNIWAFHESSDRHLWECVTSGSSCTWYRRTSSQLSSAFNIYTKAEIDPGRRQLVLIGSEGGYTVVDIDPTTYDPSVDCRNNSNGCVDVLATSSSGTQTAVKAKFATLAYDSNSGYMFSWLGGTTVYRLDLGTHNWTAISDAPGNTVDPGSASVNGDYGRWFYVPSLNVFAIIAISGNDVYRDVYVYRYSSGDPDTDPPTVNTFDVPLTSNSYTIPVTSFAASDNVGVTGYLVNESSSTPALNNPNWQSTPPTSYVVSANGVITLYAWAKDLANNISSSASDTVTVNADIVKPTVDTFDVPATSSSLTFPIIAFSASDDTGVTGYLVNESSSTPSLNDPNWQSTPQESYTASGGGSNISIYAWARDAEGNLSNSATDTITIDLGTTKNVLRVGPSRTYKTIGAAIAAAGDNYVIEVDAGNYAEKITVTQDNLTLRGVGGYAHIDCSTCGTVGKGIITIATDAAGSNGPTTIEYFELSHANNTSDNAAGIRNAAGDEAGLVVRHCYFHDNEMGILYGAGTSQMPIDITIEFSEFYNNGAGDNRSHNIYIAHVDNLYFRYNYSHYVNGGGHLFKSRASNNYVEYNRLTETNTGSYAIDIPCGGYAYVIGNIIHESSNSDNASVISFGSENENESCNFGGNPGQELHLINNTLREEKSGGVSGYWIRSDQTYPPKLLLFRNNIFYNNSDKQNMYYGPETAPVMYNNLVTKVDPGFTDADNFDFKLLETATSAINQGSEPGSANGYNLNPAYHYIHPMDKEPRPTVSSIDIGAYEFGDVSSSAPAAPRNLKIIGGQ
jgi:hypothetical protein